jgi:hypothetical protein
MLKNETGKKTWALKKEKKKQANLDESLKSRLISQTPNPLNPRPKLSQESQLPINLILKDETEKKYKFKKFSKIKNSNQKNRNKI